MLDWNSLADRVLDGDDITRDEALAVAEAPDDELLGVLNAAFKVRREHHGRKVRIHVLQNAKSGVCPEDCKFCSQSMEYEADVEQYGMQEADRLVEKAREAYEKGAATYCIVTATRGPHPNEIEAVCEAARRIKEDEELPLDICASLGLLEEGQAEELREAGVDRYNHNLETSSDHFSNVVTTHEWEDRVRTVERAKQAGMEACCGGIVGMGEDTNDWVELAFALADLEVESVPINFLNAREGTPLENREDLHPNKCLKALAMFRFVHPEADVRIAGGREEVLDLMQPFALYPANSFFTEGYLTTGGQGESRDARMLRQAGFEPVMVEPEEGEAPTPSAAAGQTSCQRTEEGAPAAE